VIFTSYFDESDTHGPAPTVVMAAFVGHAAQWRRFEKRLPKIQKRHRFRIFHSKRFKSRTGEFRNWSDQDCEALRQDMIGLSSKLTMGVAVSLDHASFMQEYRTPPIPNKMHMDSQYGACFRACLGYLLQFLEERGNKDRLNVVFENGHPNVGDCARIFHDLKKLWAESGANVLGSFTIETKESCPPLMAADMLAHTRAMMKDNPSKVRANLNAISVPFPAYTGPGGLHLIELKPNALTDLKSGFEKLRELRIAAWRAKKAARKASSPAILCG
jgi:hypothetical protein